MNAFHLGHSEAELDLTPRLAMMAGATTVATALAGAIRQKAATNVWRLDPFSDGIDDPNQPEGKGPSKLLVTGLRLFLAADVCSLLVLGSSLALQCDVPLKTWLMGGMLLGFPVDYVVQKVVDTRPAFEHYRLQVTAVRNGGDPKTMKMDRLVLLDQFRLPIDRGYVEEHQDGEYWYAQVRRDGRELVTAYQLVTQSYDQSPDSDPVSWVLEGSIDGVHWELMDQLEDQPMPLGRGEESDVLDDLMHIEDATVAFRGAFVLEVLSNAASFAWLVAGTRWVSAGAETCVDSAPLLWYSCYFGVVIMWSLIFTMVVMLAVSGVATFFVRSGQTRA